MGLTLPADMWNHDSHVDSHLGLGAQRLHPDGTAEAIALSSVPMQGHVAAALVAASDAVGVENAPSKVIQLELVKNSGNSVHPDVAALNIASLGQPAVHTHEAQAHATPSAGVDHGQSGPSIA